MDDALDISEQERTKRELRARFKRHTESRRIRVGSTPLSASSDGRTRANSVGLLGNGKGPKRRPITDGTKSMRVRSRTAKMEVEERSREAM